MQEALQKTYTKFANETTEEQQFQLLRETDAIMSGPATAMLARAGLDGNTATPFQLLDAACGSGAVGAQLQRIVPRAVLARSRVLCTDVNEPMLNLLRRRAAAEGWVDTTEVAVADAQDSKLPSESFTHVTINHGLHVIPKPEEVLKDTFRILKPGGIFAFTTMHKDNEAWSPDARSSFKALSSEIVMPDPMPMAANGRFEWNDPERVESMLRENGFEDIHVDIFRQKQHIESGEHFVTIFSMMFQWLVSICWTEEQKAKYQESLTDSAVKHLNEKHNGKGWDISWTMIMATCRKPTV